MPSMSACERIGFDGEIWPVNPARETIGGRPCYASLEALPVVPDAAMVAVPATQTVAVVRQMAELGVGGVVCYAAGFSESGKEGGLLEQELVSAAGDMALVGPNSIGFLNYLDGTAIWRDVHAGNRVARGAAVISQSGNFALRLTMNERSLPQAFVVSVGNESVVQMGDFITTLADDPRTSAIGLFIEGVRDIECFSRACEYAAQKNLPIVALKTGTSDIGQQVVLTHTASIAGSDTLYDALFDRLGIVRVSSVGAFVELLKFFSLFEANGAHRLGVLTCSGGDAALTADLVQQAGLSLPQFREHTVASLTEQLPASAHIANPLDYFAGIWGDVDALRRCFTVVMEEALDAAILILDYPTSGLRGAEAWDASLVAFAEASEQTGLPGIVIAVLPELLPRAVREQLIDDAIVPLQGLEHAIEALGAATRYFDESERRSSRAGRGRLRLPAVDKLVGELRMLDEWESKNTLGRIGLSRPPGVLVTAEEGLKNVGDIEFPVAVKVLSPIIVHKSDVGAVRVGVEREEDVASALAEMRHLGDRFLVETAVSGAVVELLIGVKRDQQLGLTLLIGSGGMRAELFDDTARLLLPVERTDVETVLDSLKCGRILSGYRGAVRGDREAATDAIMAIADYADQERHSLMDLEVNPLLVLPEGRGCVVADALIHTAELKR